MSIKTTLSIVAVATILSGCEATYDQAKADKDIFNAARLLKKGVTPGRIDYNLNRVIEYCNQIQNNECLVVAHKYYGHFYVSPLLTKHKKFFSLWGFHDPGGTYENRYQHATEHILKALSYNGSEVNYDLQTQLYMSLSTAYYALGEKDKECEALANALLARTKLYPEGNEPIEHLPFNVNRMSEFIKHEQKRVGCAKVLPVK
ncbi:hypothetical protein N473_24865 [Pseudoalteromonas luteoviolacea CPMOR-1]|uniref:Uncharacterized protein n=1 Tax=Pseudoalteromonas luteoviolacea CPMOR-1 TaxID=1365248 RepID=A0A167IXT6_9GAMM|nr:hypothetical protein [Pseudoalteromonas luteoviolacea]KZN60215.1 hypothetical protein N473_24865 [Pseudoalteromonas luteoviolacea CPMOR-1]